MSVDPHQDPQRLFIPPDRLEVHIGTMKRRGYRFVTVADFAKLLDRGPPDDVCALSFDDGIDDELIGCLERQAVPGTIYVCPGLLGTPYPWEGPPGLKLMSSDRVQELDRHELVEIGSHTVHHTILGDATYDDAVREIRDSKDALGALLGHEIPSFCYPGCLYSDAARRAAADSGHTSAVVCGPRGSWDPFELRRESLHTPNGPLTFALKSRGAYYSVRDLPPARAARAATRFWRHRRERA